MRKITISVKGQSLPVQSTPDEAERTQAAADYINAQLAALSEQVPHASLLQLMTLHALKMADEILTLQNKSVDLPEGTDDQQLLTAAVHHLTHRIDRIAEQLKAA